MSNESQAIALHHSKASGTAKVVLLGIANHDGDGGAWPALATLVKYANVDASNVRNAIKKLVALGEIRVHGNAGGMANTPDYLRPNLYEFLLECPPYCDRSRQHRDTRKSARFVPRYLSLFEEIHPGVNSPGDPGVNSPGDPGVNSPPELNQEPAIEDPASTSATPARAREQQQTTCIGGCGQPLRKGQAQSHGSCLRCVTEPGWWRATA